MENPLSNLVIDYWYKAVIVIGTVALLISMTVETHGISNRAAQLLSLGAIFVGCGEWINHPLQESVGYGFKLSGYPRKNKLGGNLLNLIGVGLVGYGIYLTW